MFLVGWVDFIMFRYLSLILFIVSSFWGCDEKDETLVEVILWGNVYSVEDTDTLNLFGHQLTGSIPSEIGNLSNLTHLYLHSNSLTGPIPPEIGNLSSLTHLYLHSNSLTGPIPPEIGNLTNLSDLSLSFNSLTGSIPPEMQNLTNLDHLNLGFNSLSGEIPEFFCNSPYLYIIYNKFCPPYPSCIENYVGYQDDSDCP